MRRPAILLAGLTALLIVAVVLILAAPSIAITRYQAVHHFRRLLYEKCGGVFNVTDLHVVVWDCQSVHVISCAPSGYNQRKRSQWDCLGLISRRTTIEGAMLLGHAGAQDCEVGAGFNPWGKTVGRVGRTCFDATQASVKR